MNFFQFCIIKSNIRIWYIFLIENQISIQIQKLSSPISITIRQFSRDSNDRLLFYEIFAALVNHHHSFHISSIQYHFFFKIYLLLIVKIKIKIRNYIWIYIMKIIWYDMQRLKCLIEKLHIKKQLNANINQRYLCFYLKR